MRITLTDKEKKVSENLQKQLDGMTYNEARQSLEHVRGIIELQRLQKMDALIFHSTSADSL